MKSVFALLASYEEVVPCYELHEPPWDSFLDFLVPEGLIALIVFWAVLLAVVALVRGQIGIFKRGLPVFPRSRWFYIPLAVASLVALILLYQEFCRAMQCV